MIIYCCGCGEKVEARLTDGSEIYPHRPDLSRLPFWKCDICANHVGCHHKVFKEEDRFRPLGCIPTPELRNARQHIHRILDPLWKDGDRSRTSVYKEISNQLGWQYHTANIRTIEEAREVYQIVRGMAHEAR